MPALAGGCEGTLLYFRAVPRAADPACKVRSWCRLLSLAWLDIRSRPFAEACRVHGEMGLPPGAWQVTLDAKRVPDAERLLGNVLGWAVGAPSAPPAAR